MLIVQEWLNCKLRMVLHYIISSSSLGIFKKTQCTSNQLMTCKCLSLNSFIDKWVLKHWPYCFAFHLWSFLPAQFLGSQKYWTVALLDLLSSLLLSTVVLLFRVLCQRLCSPHHDALLTVMLAPALQAVTSLHAGRPACHSVWGVSSARVRESHRSPFIFLQSSLCK